MLCYCSFTRLEKPSMQLNILIEPSERRHWASRLIGQEGVCLQPRFGFSRGSKHRPIKFGLEALLFPRKSRLALSEVEEARKCKDRSADLVGNAPNFMPTMAWRAASPEVLHRNDRRHVRQPRLQINFPGRLKCLCRRRGRTHI